MQIQILHKTFKKICFVCDVDVSNFMKLQFTHEPRFHTPRIVQDLNIETNKWL